jgi:hypothetical protein
MANIIGEPFKKYVAQQINTRQKAHGSGTDGTSRTPEQIAYLNSKTAWVKLASGIKVNDERVQQEGIRPGLAWGQLARNYILYGGVSSLQDGYLKQRGTYSDANNVWDYIKGTYNVSARTTGNQSTGEFGLSPMPGIIGAEIKSLNRGSIKRAEVTIKCYTPDQFQIIDLLYLRLGYTMFLEWGWSPYLDNNGNLQANYTTLIESENGFFAEKWAKKSYSAFLPAIEGYRKGKKGNYDGLLCKVVNFSWTFAQDGSYDITLSLISLGDVVESLKLNIPPSKPMSEFINQSYALYNNKDSEDTSIIPSPADNIISSYLFLQKLYLDKDNNPDGNGKDSSERADVDNCDVYSTINGTRIPLAGHFVLPPKDGILTIPAVYDSSPTFDSKEEALTWLKNSQYKDYAEVSSIVSDPADAEEALSSYNSNCYTVAYYAFYFDTDTGSGGVNDYVVYTKSFPSLETTNTNQKKKDVVYLNYNNGEDDTDFINDTGFYMRLGHLLEFIRNFAIPKIDGTNKPLVEIDSGQWSNLMYSVPYQVSFDPRVCIVNGGELVSKKDFFPTLEGWKNTENGYAWVMNVYLSHNQILTSLNGNTDEKGNVALFDFLQDICNAINKAVGGVNNLEVILDEEINTLKIIDGNYNPRELKKDYTLELYGYNPTNNQSNFVRNFTLKTEITNDFATMATVGSTAGGYVKGTENTMFSKWNKGLIDRWKEKLVPGDEASREKEGEVAEANSEYKENIWKQRLSAFGYTLLDIESWNLSTTSGDTAGLSDEIIDKNVAIATEFYKYVQPEIQKEVPKYGSPLQGFIPINLSITMDGISGIKIYNALNVSTRFLPKNYPDSLKFIIKGVNHSLKDNDWETNIETVTIAQNEE